AGYIDSISGNQDLGHPEIDSISNNQHLSHPEWQVTLTYILNSEF
ncbi:hypothetical protein SAMN05216349_12547, partial [Oribacterium sp. KHPX15]